MLVDTTMEISLRPPVVDFEALGFTLSTVQKPCVVTLSLGQLELPGSEDDPTVSDSFVDTFWHPTYRDVLRLHAVHGLHLFRKALGQYYVGWTINKWLIYFENTKQNHLGIVLPSHYARVDLNIPVVESILNSSCHVHMSTYDSNSVIAPKAHTFRVNCACCDFHTVAYSWASCPLCLTPMLPHTLSTPPTRMCPICGTVQLPPTED